MNILIWILFGGLAGWIASMFAGTNEEQGIFANIIVGIIGAFLGGFIATRLGADGVTGFNLQSFVVAVLGAVIFLVILKILF